MHKCCQYVYVFVCIRKIDRDSEKTYVVEGSAIDVLPTSPQALLSSCFIAANSITTNIVDTDDGSVALIWDSSKPVRTQVISNYHHHNTWRGELTAALWSLSHYVLEQQNSFTCGLIERAIKVWCHCRLYSFAPVYIIRTQRCSTLPVGTNSQVLRAISYMKRMFECALIAHTVSEQVQTKKPCSALKLKICLLSNVPLGYWVSAAYLS